MALVKAGSAAALPPGSLMQVEIGGNNYAVCNSDGVIHALDGTCPHAGGPIGEGALHGITVVCPWHAWEFDCTTGQCDVSEDVRLAKFEVKVDGDDILVNVP